MANKKYNMREKAFGDIQEYAFCIYVEEDGVEGKTVAPIRWVDWEENLLWWPNGLQVENKKNSFPNKDTWSSFKLIKIPCQGEEETCQNFFNCYSSSSDCEVQRKKKENPRKEPKTPPKPEKTLTQIFNQESALRKRKTGKSSSFATCHSPRQPPSSHQTPSPHQTPSAERSFSSRHSNSPHRSASTPHSRLSRHSMSPHQTYRRSKSPRHSTSYRPSKSPRHSSSHHHSKSPRYSTSYRRSKSPQQSTSYRHSRSPHHPTTYSQSKSPQRTHPSPRSPSFHRSCSPRYSASSSRNSTSSSSHQKSYHSTALQYSSSRHRSRSPSNPSSSRHRSSSLLHHSSASNRPVLSHLSQPSSSSRKQSSTDSSPHTIQRSPPLPSLSPHIESSSQASYSNDSRANASQPYKRRDSALNRRFPMEEGEFQKLVLTILLDLTEKKKKNARQDSNQIIDKMGTVEDFKKMEDSLKDKDKFLETVCSLKRIGGKTVRENVKHILDRLMDVNLMEEFNMCGKKRKDVHKDGFASKKFCQAVVEAVKSGHKDCTEAEITEEIGNLLKQAPFRRGGSKSKTSNE